MQYRTCAHCRAVIGFGEFRCPSCGIGLLGIGKVRRVKLCKRDGTPVPVKERCCTTCGEPVSRWYMPWWGWLPVLMLISMLASLLLNNLHQYVYSTYQPETCSITNAEVDTYTNKTGSTYSPMFTYTVIGSKGQYIASGDGDMGLDSSSWDDAQQALNQHPAGSTYGCWYSAIGSPAALFRQPTLLDDYVVFWFLGITLLLFVLEWCMVRLILYSWGFYKRMAKTTGKVIGYKFFRTVSIVVFQTNTKSPLKCRTQVYGIRRLGSSVGLYYDWRNPAKNSRTIMKYHPAYSLGMELELILTSALMLTIAGFGTWFFLSMAWQF